MEGTTYILDTSKADEMFEEEMSVVYSLRGILERINCRKDKEVILNEADKCLNHAEKFTIPHIDEAKREEYQEHLELQRKGVAEDREALKQTSHGRGPEWGFNSVWDTMKP